jgi:hypothetical protein
MPLIIASIVVPILLIWVIYKVIRLFFMTAESVHEAKKEDKEYAEYLKTDEDKAAK